ncbi:motility associated factor glycosyltransferase family protein [Sporosarcina koreensis]|uniref:Motility associated factor glycosyltransferase family protein n=1 Tax=Sporosarcina koreensis TaxID=334735 RepID=A0ABW0U096_9BACL
MKILLDGRAQYLQSKYDPQSEAERFVNKFADETIKHVLFVGIGGGYHIKRFMETHPDSKFSIYEPDEEVLHAYLSHFQLEQLPLHNLVKIFVGKDIKAIESEIKQLLSKSNNVLKIITLPVYEKIYGVQIQTIFEQTLESLKERHSSLTTNISFQKRWTINSIKNFPTLFKTPNILYDIDRSSFEGKPAIIVAAGPSLNEEFENLRYIKENGLAYIFSVGSAINALIDQGIYPDAACTYDPSELNQYVFQKLKDENISEIPLIFGSSVGFETLEEYPGKMFHMITSQDSVSPQLLDTTQSIDIVLDAPSIAVVTFQLLCRLKCNPILLVGQNLGYIEKKRYASGIKYNFVENEVSEEEQKKALIIKDVYGNDIQTDDSFNSMRQQLEMHIGMNENFEVINTTKGGAKIKGTHFAHLKDLIKERLNTKQVIFAWKDQNPSYEIQYTDKRLELLAQAEKNCGRLARKLLETLSEIHQIRLNRQWKNIEKHFAVFDKQFEQLKRNAFYNGFIEPMIRVQNERLSEESKLYRYERDINKKVDVIVQVFNAFLQEVHLHHEFVKPYFEELKLRIENLTNNDKENG